MRTRLHSRWIALLITGVTALSGCDLRTYTFGGGDDDDDGDAGQFDARTDGGGGGGIDAAVDAGPDACVGVIESCNTADDDCDGMVDETYNLDEDPANCGACGNRCLQPNTAGTCAAATCAFACLPGWVDRDGDASNGCDYFCTPTNGGVEICDFADNNCDGDIDEGLNLENDVNNCGACGNVCRVLNATATCEDSTCGFDVCDVGFADVVPAIPGCEYTCPVFPPVAETCNNVDDDCDGIIDNGTIAGVGEDCTTPGATTGDTGECTFGQTVCAFGVLACQGYEGPVSETCNNLDDDCDGDSDETFDKQNDPRTCGSCSPCNLPNSIEGCSGGNCTVATCLNGFVNLDGLPGNGCEYACTRSGPEVCDGLDNDCDGLVDTADPQLTAPGNFCRQQGECSGTTPTCSADPCTSVVTWRCDYPGSTEADACGILPFQESECDEVDGDCDGRVDESFASKGAVCADSGLGECRGTGEFICSTDGTAVTCDITVPGEVATPEVCDGLDNDCDGDLDNDAPDEVVEVQVGGSSVWVYTYEASRPDADDTNFGSLEHRSCSRPGALPWRNVTWMQAEAACAAAGRRLCSENEWQEACEGPSGFTYPYGNTYDPYACNGKDHQYDCGLDNEVFPTASAYGCPAPLATECVGQTGTIDMSGNLREWTGTEVAPGVYRVRGGGYDNIEQGLTCQLSFIALDDDSVALPNLGFRCCGDAP